MENPQQPEDEKKERAGWLGLLCSVIVPIIGITLYFVKRKEVENPEAYLYAMMVGFLWIIVLRFFLRYYLQ